ncbi:metallophosphoesterase [Roseovarius sp. S4756]|uniref:metallophosphoesterase n=1 Tax=Roseovarius maritimus TaxID=3342637 RepID=UPI00372B200D
MPPAPTEPFLAIGDVHGRADLLIELDRLIEIDHSDWPVVFLGDYIDRGEESCQVLKLLMSATADVDYSVTCLMGNHERMLLDFLDEPSRYARRWLHNGGLQTLASFGVALPIGSLEEPEELELLRDHLATAMGPEMIEWMSALPLAWHSGNVWAVHAGASPTCPMDEQDTDVLLWGHREFSHQVRVDGQWIVHGHSIVDGPQVHQGRISVDTGAYATGVLTAAAITHDGITFLQTGGM